MDAPARFSFDRGVPSDDGQYDEKVRHGRVTFATDGVDDEFYKPIPKYEGIHRYDPGFTWEPKEEKRVVRKV